MDSALNDDQGIFLSITESKAKELEDLRNGRYEAILRVSKGFFRNDTRKFLLGQGKMWDNPSDQYGTWKERVRYCLEDLQLFFQGAAYRVRDNKVKENFLEVTPKGKELTVYPILNLLYAIISPQALRQEPKTEWRMVVGLQLVRHLLGHIKNFDINLSKSERAALEDTEHIIGKNLQILELKESNIVKHGSRNKSYMTEGVMKQSLEKKGYAIEKKSPKSVRKEKLDKKELVKIKSLKKKKRNEKKGPKSFSELTRQWRKNKKKR